GRCRRGRCSVGSLAASQLIQTARVWITATIPPCAFASGRLHELTAPACWRMQQPLGPGTAVGSRSRAWRPRGGRTYCLAYWGRERRTSPPPPAAARGPRGGCLWRVRVPPPPKREELRRRCDVT